jgi:aldehyde dehydrogenase (NAD+)
MQIKELLNQLGITQNLTSGSLAVHSPIDGSVIAKLHEDDASSVNQKIIKAQEAFTLWREVPAPKRGELIRIFGNELRAAKEPLARLITIECGKILEEGKGEVQEMVDICDFAVGLSRTIGGLTIPSERPMHIMHENWLPLGVVGVVSAFNFPAAVWAWNFSLAVICGDSVVWKPSEKTPLCAMACAVIFNKAVTKSGIKVPEGLMEIIIGRADVGEKIISDSRIALVSATGSTKMGGHVAPVVARRFGKCLLELGGNNGVIVTPRANLDVAMPSILFGAIGTAGQRCTSTRRVFVHGGIYEDVFGRLQNIYAGLGDKIGNPLESGKLVGPLIDKAAFDDMQDALKKAKESGGRIFGGERVLLENKDAYYVTPALVKIANQAEIVKHETFAPILYVMPYDTLDEAMNLHNDVTQGLSSAIFTDDLREAEFFKRHSDCGIANVNIGTSGAEIGGAFGGEKETGGGRESGSDAWKNYMRRQTSTTYYGRNAPELAQGISFA